MSFPVLLFPDTVARPSLLGRLTPLCQPLCVLAPPSLDQGGEPAYPAALVQVARPTASTGADQAADDQPRRMAGLLRQWEGWARQHHGSGLLEAVKAGVLPQPPETVRTVMSELKNYGQSVVGQEQPPGVAADLFLHLAHIHDRQAADIEQALAQYENERRELARSMGHDQQGHDPAEFEGLDPAALPPVDYSQALDHLLPRRLSAWSVLADALEDDQPWLISADAQAVQTLIERANARFAPGDGLRSPAGASAPFGSGVAAAGSARAQVAAGLDLPDLGQLTPVQLEALIDKLGPELAAIQAELNDLLQWLASAPWNAQTQAEAARRLTALGDRYAALLAAVGLRPAGVNRLDVVVFPGLGRADLLKLMRGETIAEPAAAGAFALLWLAPAEA